MNPYTDGLNRLRRDRRSTYTLAAEIGIPRETVRDIKTGRIRAPRWTTMQKIAGHYLRRRGGKKRA
jgi:DNA-binding XRE family transcriptional regulator